MNISQTMQETKTHIQAWRKKGQTIGFVPTMGYLHEGHKSLIEASARENDKTVVSIFINPTQFAPAEDFNSYPRDFSADTALCNEADVDLIFHPSAEEMYPAGSYTFVDMDTLTKGLCGKTRPHHFRGVCTVVCKLFNIITPNRAYFGQKDAQQLAVIKRMARDLNMDVCIVACPIVREPDGLAKSSRNTYLSLAEREAALVLSRSLFAADRLVKDGETNAGKIAEAIQKIIQAEPLAQIDYVEIVDGETLTPVSSVNQPALAAVAVKIGKTRLIDNIVLTKGE